MAIHAHKNIGWTTPSALFILLAVYAFGPAAPSIRPTDGSVRGEASIQYCSRLSSTNCQAGVAKVELTFRTRHPEAIDLYGYNPSSASSVKIQDLEIRLNDRAKDLLPTGDLFLFHDSDNDGLLTSSDSQVARGLLQGKSIIFEDLNFVLKSTRYDPQIVSSTTFFFSNPEGFADVQVQTEDETTRQPFFKGVNVGARDLKADNRRVSFVEVFADLSLFDRLDSISLSRSDLLTANPVLGRGDADNEVTLGPGVIELSQTLIVSEGLALTVAPDTTLLLGPSVSLVSYSPVTMIGTEERPISFEALDDAPFGAIGVIGSIGEDAESTFRHVHIEGGSEDWVNGAHLSGMVSIYRNTQITIEHSTFSLASADDALNVKYGNLTLTDSHFQDNAADGFDGDFISGTIMDSTFIANGNDSIDLSGSTVTITHNLIRESGDKGISIGEASTVDARLNIIDSSQIGIEFKDSSTGLLENNLIQDSLGVGLNSYIKKTIFDAPSFEYRGNVIVGSTPAIGGLVDESQLPANSVAGFIEPLIGQFRWLEQIMDDYGY